MQTNRPTLLMLSMAMLVLFGAGCTSATEVSTEPRVAHLEHNESGFTVTVERGEARATIIVQRSGPRAEGFIRDPEIDSPYEFDRIFRNRHGYPFSISIGGDRLASVGFIDRSEFVDPETGENALQPPEYTDNEEQLEDFDLIADAALMLRNHPDIGDAFRWELRAAHYSAAASRDDLRELMDGLREGRTPPVEPTPSALEIESEALGPITIAEGRADGDPVRSSDSVGVAVAYLGSGYFHQATIRWANCCWDYGQHSSVLLRVYSDTWTLLTTVSTKNHGREADDPSMSTASGCPYTWGVRANYLPPLQPYISTDTFWSGDAGGCGTSYGLTSGTHVCNDDSLVEYWHVKYNAGGSWVTCGDSTLRDTAPTCY